MTASDIRWQCPPKVVLTGVDFGDASARALAIAGVVAAGFGARLRSLHAERFEPPAYFTIEQIARLEAERQTAQQAAAAHIVEFAAGHTPHAVEPLVVDLPPVDALLEAAHGADLLVLGTHGRRGPGRWWLGSVAERVVRASAIPVLVTRAADTPPLSVFERLAVVEDGSNGAAAAHRVADHFARLAGGTIVQAGPLPQCGEEALRHASLVVMATPVDRRSWGFTDAVGDVLGACDRPVLFVPGAISE